MEITIAAFLHTVPGHPATFDRMLKDRMPSVRTMHMVDGEFLANAIEEHSLTTSDAEDRLQMYAEFAHRAGACAMLVTCSSLGPTVEHVRQQVPLRIVRIDEGMARTAVQRANHVGVIGTLEATMSPSMDLVERVATDLGRDVEVTGRLAEGAFTALLAGDTWRHDEAVVAALQDLETHVDLILLAQSSIARILEGDNPIYQPRVPVLTNTELAMDELVRGLPTAAGAGTTQGAAT